MNITTPKDTIAFAISNENINLTQEIPTKFINKTSSCSVNTATNITRNIANISLNQKDYKIALHFKNGGLLKQLTFEQFKILIKIYLHEPYNFTDQDIIELKDKPEFIEYLDKQKIVKFSELPEEVKQNPVIAIKAFVAGDHSFIKYIPKELQTQEIFIKAFNYQKLRFFYIAKKFKTFEICSQYLEDCDFIYFELIPENFRCSLQQKFIDKIKTQSLKKISGIELLPLKLLQENPDIVHEACLSNSDVITKLNPCLITTELLTELAKKSICCIPKQYLNIDLVLLSIRHSNFDTYDNYSKEEQLKIIDEYFLSYKTAIQEEVSKRLYIYTKSQAICLLKYMPNLSERKCFFYLHKDIANYNDLPEKYKLNLKVLKYVIEHWLLNYNHYKTTNIIKNILLQYKNLPEKSIEFFPSYFFTQESTLFNKHYVRTKNKFLLFLPNEYKTLDLWIYICTNINRKYIRQIPKFMITDKLLMLLIDEYVQDDSRFDIEFTEYLFAHKIFNSQMQEKILAHTIKCSARCSRVFINILRSLSIPQEFKEEIFNNIMIGNLGYPQLDIAELYAKTNPLKNQIPANFATSLLSSFYKFNGFNKFNSAELINELKTHMAARAIDTLPLDTTENIFTNAKIAGGRTIQVDLNTNNAIFYKFRKPREKLSEFIKEGYFLDFLAENNAGKKLKDKLISDIPILKKMVRIPLDDLPKHVSQCEDGLDIYTDNNGIQCVDVLVFSCSRDYLQYAHKPDINNPENQFVKPEQGILKACHDLGIFMSHGIYHTTTLPLFHFKQDYRKWSVLNMILRGLPDDTIRGVDNGYIYLNQYLFSMPGKLESWDTTAIERSDYRYSGLCDLGDHEFYGEIASIENRNDSNAFLFETIKQKTHAANTICECLIAMILLYARLHKFSVDYHYTDNNCREHTARFIENLFTSFLVGILQDETINLQKFMQLSTEDYVQWLDRAVTELLYWTAEQPKIEEKHDSAIKDCFSYHVNQQKLPEFLFNDTNVLIHIKYPKSFTINEYGKTHNNLGMYNGTFPLLALINFIILFNTRLNEYKIKISY